MGINLQQITKEKERIWNFINSKIQGHFDKEFVDFSKRVRVEADLEKWRPDVEEIWQQKKGKVGNHYSLYFDDEFVCSFSTDDPPGLLEARFLKNLTKLYEEETIFFDLNEYTIRAEIKKIEEEKEREEIDKKTKTDNPDVKKIIKELDEPENA
jgi:hypothetical protein